MCPSACVEEVQDVVIVESDGKKVCGTDGQIYASECLMKISACKKQQYIVVANKGDCGRWQKTFFSTFSAPAIYVSVSRCKRR